MMDGAVAVPAQEEDDLDRPVTRREFNVFVDEMRAWIAMERKRQEAERAEKASEIAMESKRQEAERAEKASEKAKIDAIEKDDKEERDLMQKKWQEGKLVDYTFLFFRIHQGSACFNQHHHGYLVGGHAKAE